MNCIAKSQSSSISIIDDDTNDSKNFFSPDFFPGNNHVLIGRGKKCSMHAGNERLRRLVAYHLDQYSAATTKKEKTKILLSIVSNVRMGTPKQKGGFVKLDSNTGLWFEVGDFTAREKVSQAFRDALHNNYRSSNEFKKKRKREQSLSRFAKIMQSSKRSRVLQEPSSSVEQDEQRQIDRANKNDDLLLSPNSLAVLDLESSMGMGDIAGNVSKLRSFLPDSYSLTSWFEDDYYESNYNPLEPIPISMSNNKKEAFDELYYDEPLLPLPDHNFDKFMEAIDDVSFSNDDYVLIFDETKLNETTVCEPRNGYKAWKSHHRQRSISQPFRNSCAARTA